MPNVIHKLALLIAGPLCIGGQVMADAIPVELIENEQGWQLLRGGEPYFIRGAGGEASLEMLAAAGANSLRTWGGDDIGPLLDKAHELGLSVTVGIWLGHERHGFDYSDQAQVAGQLEKARQTVLRYKDHPAVLIWGIGNEMEGYDSGDSPAIWKAVNDVAAMAKEIDPDHPTMTVTAEIGGGRIASLHKHSPAIDIHGINSYGGAPSLAERYRAGGATKPYVLTEFGPPGAWEAPKNDWGAAMELTSTQKSASYRRHYERAVTEQEGLALGSYAFTWGFKMEATATWFGMFLSDGSRLAAVDVMTELWSGTPPENLAPVVEPLLIDVPPELDPGDRLQVRANISDPEGGPTAVQWVLRPESGEYLTGGDFRPNLPDVEGVILEGNEDGALLRMPEEPGPYRLFLTVHDEAGNAATANLPLLVKGEVRTRMPFSVYDDGFEAMPWVPTGWMGSTEFLTLDGSYAEEVQNGSASIKIRYAEKFGWAGIAWQNPPNNWGEQDGGFDLTGATELELWARGEYGGEKISLSVGLIGSDQAYPDSGKTRPKNVVLTRDWKRYSVSLKRMDLSSIKTGFAVTLVGRTTPVTIYLDSIRFVR